MEQIKWFTPGVGESGWALGSSISIRVQTHEVVIANHLPAYSKQQNKQNKQKTAPMVPGRTAQLWNS